MNIKKISDKPMIIHTKKQTKIHLRASQGRAIRKKIIPDSVKAMRKQDKNSIWQRMKESRQSIKMRNRSLWIMAEAGARMGARQVEGGEEIKDSIDLLATVSAPIYRAVKYGGMLYRRKQTNKKKQQKSRQKCQTETEYAASSIHARKQSVKRNKRRLGSDGRGTFKKKDFKETGINGVVKGRMLDTFLEKFRAEQEEEKDLITSVKEAAKAAALIMTKQVVVFAAPFFLGASVLISIMGIIVVAVLAVIYHSPLSIFFPLPDTGYDNPRTVLCEYYKEFNQQITSLEEQGYVISYQNSGDGVSVFNFNDTLQNGLSRT